MPMMPLMYHSLLSYYVPVKYHALDDHTKYDRFW